MGNLVIVRHGESQWNREDRFTGWADVDLTANGIEQARCAGRALAKAGFHFDLAITSMLKRSIRSQWLMLDEMNTMFTPIISHWRLNERHYGALTGHTRAEMITKFGAEQVWAWRRGFASRSPLMDINDPRAPQQEARYDDVSRELLPLGESLEDTVERVRVLWDGMIAPVLRQGKDVIISSHGNSQRALVKLLEDMPDSVPLVYKLDKDLRVLERSSMTHIPHPAVSAIL